MAPNFESWKWCNQCDTYVAAFGNKCECGADLRPVSKVEVKRLQDGYDLGMKMCDMLNTIGAQSAVVVGMLTGMIHSHRSLQQSCGRAILELICRYGDLRAHTFVDPRNEAFHKMCQKLQPIIEEYGKLPMI